MPPEDDTKTGDQSQAPSATAKDDTKPAVSFKTEGEFLATIERKTKKAVEAAIEKTRSELFSVLGVESADEIEGLKTKIAATDKTVSEFDKLRGAHDKVTKDLDKERKKSGDLSGRLKGIAKRDALQPFVAQVRDPEALAMFADPHLEVDDDGAVSVKNGKSVEDFVTDLLKAKEYLRIPTAKEGAGTTATEPRKPNDGKADDGKAAADAKNGTAQTPQHASFGAFAVANLRERGALKGP